jgi:hypothetical protein
MHAKAHRTFGSQAHKESLMLRFFHQIMSEKTTERLVSLPFFFLYLSFFALCAFAVFIFGDW